MTLWMIERENAVGWKLSSAVNDIPSDFNDHLVTSRQAETSETVPSNFPNNSGTSPCPDQFNKDATPASLPPLVPNRKTHEMCPPLLNNSGTSPCPNQFNQDVTPASLLPLVPIRKTDKMC